jgi:hypothetical protein
MEDALKTKLTDLGLSEGQVTQLEEKSGAKTAEDLAMLSDAEIVMYSGCTPIAAKKVAAAFAPAPVATMTSASVDPNAELDEDAKPSAAQVNGLASSLGIDSSVLMMMFAGGASGMGSDLDISGMIPVARVVEGYNPKVRNMFLMLMGQIESRHAVPVVIINNDGSVNKALTSEYIEGLDEGREPAENNIYFDEAGQPYEAIKVGVDAQSVYDADPLSPEKALQKNGMGFGRINWSGVSLEVRQVAFLATMKTKEIDPTNDAHLTWLRDHMKKEARRLVFHGQAPRAIAEYNEAYRTGSLPTLRVMLSRGPRRKETMPRRRPAGLGVESTINNRYMRSDA